MPRTMSLKTIGQRIRQLMQKAEEIKPPKDSLALRKVVHLMREYDISVDELRSAMNGRSGMRNSGASRGSPLRKKKIKPMYRDSKTGETWSGRGRPARWIAAAEKAGRKRTEFLVKKS
jgi:DNA-binding protein H-NS